MAKLPECLSRMAEPEWSALIPSGSVLIIEREGGYVEIYSHGKTFPWNDGKGLLERPDHDDWIRHLLSKATMRTRA